MLLYVLFSITILANNISIPHARIQCAEIARHTDIVLSTDSDYVETLINPLDGAGAVLITDSRGRMVYTAPLGKYHCRSWDIRDTEAVCENVIEVTRHNQQNTIDLFTCKWEVEPPAKPVIPVSPRSR